MLGPWSDKPTCKILHTHHGLGRVTYYKQNLRIYILGLTAFYMNLRPVRKKHACHMANTKEVSKRRNKY